MITAILLRAFKIVFVFSVLCATLSASPMARQDKAADEGGVWGNAVDGLACRLTVQPRFTVAQPIKVLVEIKNVSNKRRYVIRHLDLEHISYVSLTINGPKGKVVQTRVVRTPGMLPGNFHPIEPGEVKQLEVRDLDTYFPSFTAWTTIPERKTNAVSPGKYDLRLRFVSPKIPPVYKSGKPEKINNTPDEMLAGEWAGEIEAVPVSFELLPLGKEDLVIHEWGVFTVLNDSKYANANRKDEWGSLPTFFYRQFPKVRVPWMPSSWDKPLVHVYAKPNPMQINIKVTFAEGTPVVWWPATTDPVDNSPDPQKSKNNKRYRWLTWDAWVSDTAPFNPGNAVVGDPLPLGKLVDFPLPPDSWLQHARLAKASQLSVIGTKETGEAGFLGGRDQIETERFLYYDGLVPAPDYLHCEKTDVASVTLRNGAAFDLRGLFVVDRRIKGKTAFAFVDGVKQPFKAGATLDVKLQPVTAADWPAVGVKQVRQALLDAGLFEPEADSVIKIWQNRLLEAEGLVAFHILPQSEYDRMLPLDVLPAPLAKPVRVGIALHPNLEIEHALRQRVAKLVKELDSDVYAQRAAASKELLEIGPVAIGVLRAALHKQPSLEARRRIEAVIDSVDGTEWLSLPKTEKKKG